MVKNDLPEIKWIKNDPKKHVVFYDGSTFLVALRVNGEWDFDRVVIHCDEDFFSIEYECGCSYDAWEWEDVEYFYLLNGNMPEEQAK